MIRAPLILIACAMLEGWLSERNERRAPACPERDVLAVAVAELAAFVRGVRLSRGQVDEIARAFDRWRTEHEGASLHRVEAQHLAVIAQVQVWLDTVLTELRAAHAQRAARGRTPDTAKLDAVARVNDALGALERVLARRLRHAGEKMLAAEIGSRVAEMGL